MTDDSLLAFLALLKEVMQRHVEIAHQIDMDAVARQAIAAGWFENPPPEFFGP